MQQPTNFLSVKFNPRTFLTLVSSFSDLGDINSHFNERKLLCKKLVVNRTTLKVQFLKSDFRFECH